MARLTTAQLAARFGSNAKSSLEDNDVNININADVDGEGEENEGFVEEAEALDTSDTPEAAELDVADAGAEVEDTVEDTEAVSESIDGLESLYLTLAQISEEGLELGAGGAALLRNHVNQLTGKYGLGADDIGVASQEDLTMFPNSALQDSMEGIGETIKAAYQKLIEFLKKIGSMISTFVKSLFDAATAAKVKIAKLRKMLSSGSVKEKKVTVPALLGNNGVNVSGIEALKDVTSEITKQRTEKFVQKFNQDTGLNETDVEAILKDFKSTIVGYKNKELAGNIRITIDADDFAKVESTDSGKSKVENLTKADANKYLDLADSLVKVVEGYRSTEKDRKKTLDSMAAKLKADSVNAAKDENMRKRITASMTPRRLFVRNMNKIVGIEVKLIGKCGSVANGLCNVVAKFASKKAEANAE